MPVLVVHGLSNTTANQGDINQFLGHELPKAASSVKEMKITRGLVTVFAPVEVAFNGFSDIVIFVEGLWMREERNQEVLKDFAEAIKDCAAEFVQKHVPDCDMIEVIPRSQRTSDGFASWERST